MRGCCGLLGVLRLAEAGKSPHNRSAVFVAFREVYAEQDKRKGLEYL